MLDKIKATAMILIKKALRRGFFRIMYIYIKEIRRGYEIIEGIASKYGKNVYILVHAWPGMGDIFLLHEYLPYYLENNLIQDYVIVVSGKAARQVVELYGIDKIEQVTAKENASIMQFKQFVGAYADKIHILHHDPPAMHIGIGNMIQGINQTTTRDMLLGVDLKLPNTDVEPAVCAHFDYDENYIKKLFKKNGLIPGKTVILSPHANSCATAIPGQTWVGMAADLKDMGFSVCTNCGDPNENGIEGTRTLSFPLKYSKPVLEYAGYFIAARSGLCDVVGRAKCKMYLFYRAEGICGKNKESNYFNIEKIGLGSGINEYATYDYTVRVAVNQVLDEIKQDSSRHLQKGYKAEYEQDANSISPAFQKNNIAIAFACSNEYVPYLFVTLRSILDNSSADNNYDILILEEDISKDNKELLIKTYRQDNVVIRFVDIAKFISGYDLYTWGWYKPIMYGRFLLPDLMKEYEKVLYLDCDLVALVDVAQLFNLKMGGSECIAAVRDVGMINTYCTPKCKEKEYFDNEIKLSNPLNYINSGVLLFNIPAVRKRYSVDDMLKLTASKKWMWQDQDVLMVLFEGKIKFLEQSWNVMIQSMEGYPDLMGTYAPKRIQDAYKDARNNPKIIHYISNKYLQFNPVCDLYYYFWMYAKRTPYYEMILLRAFSRNL